MPLTQISTAGVKDDAVTAGKIPADAIGSSEIAANAVGSSELADNAVDTAAIANQAVTTAKLADDSVGTQQISAQSIGTTEIAPNAVATSKIADDAVTYAKMQNTANGVRFLGKHDSGGGAVGEITAAQALTMLNVESGATADQTAGEIKTLLQSDKLTASEIANDTITAVQLANNSANVNVIVDGAVTTAKLATDAVTGAKLADNAVVRANITDGEVTSAKLDSNAVTTSKINNNAVTNAKVADDAIGIAELSATGTASSSTFLRGDNSWTAVNTDISGNLDGGLSSNGYNINFANSNGSQNMLKFGGGDNLKVYYDGSESRIKAVSGPLDIRTSSSHNVEILANDKYSFWGQADGMTAIYHNGVRKLETASDGIEIHGRLIVDNLPAFHASQGSAHTSANNYIVYSNVTQQGSHYNTSNGRFTAPYHGVYFFYYSNIKSNLSGVTRSYIRKNGSNLGPELRMDQGPNYGDNGCQCMSVVLNANDYVQIYVTDNAVHANHYTTFGGHYLG